ncbi:MarR family transcriptional regulator [Bacillus swezeyi]|uniref:MarR family transcriptional regulator n=1 Tax=Bacillus swezeyi TaxID=1925020 RepID=A0A5M8RWL1_9BACI|nr:MarR family transcriptional regulator [Bacillus swezeyi]KAA6451878.1 MarR family transcriptional regulator [Bacillus swezeyi]TYS36100.1 MarR family transcriptional regulator [Bacillus swezeyi]
MSELTKQLIYDMYVKLLHLNEQKADTDLKALLKQADEADVKGLPGNMTTIHVISCIGHSEPINNTGIAKKMNLSKANITKISSRLLKEGLIKRFQLTDNRKEVYFRLTPSGKQVFELHEKLHQKKAETFDQFLDSFSESEQSAILKFLQGLTVMAGKKQEGTRCE